MPNANANQVKIKRNDVALRLLDRIDEAGSRSEQTNGQEVKNLAEAFQALVANG